MLGPALRQSSFPRGTGRSRPGVPVVGVRIVARAVQLLQRGRFPHVVRHLPGRHGFREVIQLQIRVHILHVTKLVKVVLVPLHVIIHQVFEIRDVLRGQGFVVHQPKHELHALDVLEVAGHGLLEVPESRRPRFGF